MTTGIIVGQQTPVPDRDLSGYRIVFLDSSGQPHPGNPEFVRLSGEQIRDRLDGLLGMAWREGLSAADQLATIERAFELIGGMAGFTYTAIASPGGGTLSIADGSLVPDKILASDETEQDQWRTKIGAVSLMQVGAVVAAAIDTEAAARGSADTALGTRIDGKQDALPALGENQIWLGKADGSVVAGVAPSGGGDVTTAQLNTEIQARSSADTALGVRIDGETSARETADATETKARQDADTVLAGKIGVKGTLGIVPKNIDAYTDVDGTYEIAAYNLDVAYLNSQSVDQYEIWFKEESVHTTTGTWTPETDFTVDVTVDTTEETSIALSASDEIVPVQMIFRASGSFVDKIVTYLTIGDDRSQEALPTLGNSQYWATDGSGTLAARDIPSVSGGADATARAGVAANTAAIATLQTRSDEGDEIGVSSIANATQLERLFGSQETSDNAAWVYFTADVTEVHQGTTHTYKARDLAYFSPRNIIGKVVANLPPNLLAEIAKLTDIVAMNTGSIAISPNNIPNAAAVTRDYVFAWEDLDDNWLKSKGVNQLDIWMKDTGFHAVRPFAPTKDGVITVNVNATEAAAIAIGSSKIVPVRAVFRNSGTFVALVNTWLTIGDLGGIEAKFTQAQQIGLLSVHPDPSIIVYPNDGLETALTRTIALQVANPEVLTGDIWAQGSIDGQAVLARTKWASNLAVLNFAISAQLAALIGQNDSLDVRLDFYDAANAGNIVESLRYGVSLVEQADAGAAGATAAQAAAIAANTTGRTANAGAIARNLSSINTERGRITAEISRAEAAEKLLSDRIDEKSEAVIHYSDPATTPPAEGEVLIWEGSIYTYGPKELLLRTLLGSDFRRPGSNTWGGVISARPSSPPDNIIYYTFTGYGSISANMFTVSNGGGTSPLDSAHTPASWAAYNDLAAATAAVNAGNTVIILPTGGFFVTEVLQERWVLTANGERLGYPGTETRPLRTLNEYSRIAYSASNFPRGTGLNPGQFMVGESTHAKQIVFRLRDEDLAMHDYLEIGLGMGGSTPDNSVIVRDERIESAAKIGESIIRLTLAEAGFENFPSNASVFLEAQSKIDKRLQDVEIRIQSARDLTGVINLDSDTYNIVNATLIGNATVGITGGSDGDVFELRVTQDSTGSRTLALASSIKSDGSSPEIQSGVNQRTVIYFEYIVDAWHFRVAVNG